MKATHAAGLLALALTVAPFAFAGEGHSCCMSDKAKKQTTAAKCDPKDCPPGKCDKDKMAACEKSSAAAKKADVKDAKQASPKPQV